MADKQKGFFLGSFPSGILFMMIFAGVSGFGGGNVSRDSGEEDGGSLIRSFKAKAKPAASSAPLDPNEAIAHELDGLNQILGILGPASGGLVASLTGISIHDCAGQLKGKDMDTITCSEFIEELSKCESLTNVKDLVSAAGKKKYKGKMNSKEPCFADKKKRSKKSGKPKHH